VIAATKIRDENELKVVQGLSEIANRRRRRDCRKVRRGTERNDPSTTSVLAKQKKRQVAKTQKCKSPPDLAQAFWERNKEN